MTGRGIDQILPHPGDPRLREPYVMDARSYVELAEAESGWIPRPVAPSYIWGDALEELEAVAPDARVVNLETSVTLDGEFWDGKVIHYRMHPENIACLTAAGIDVCALANNHVLDFGHEGLVETIETLEVAGIKVAGAGRNLGEASRPATLGLGRGGALVVYSFGSETSGVPPSWAATEDQAGVDFLPDLTERTAASIGERIHRMRRPSDVVVASIHWGSNWGYEVPRPHVRFAHRLVEEGVDIVHGHSSHHPRPIEVYRGKLILYGCGDLLNDYEGITGYEEFRDDLVLMYFVTVAADSGDLVALRMTPMRIQRCRLNRASRAETRWMRDTVSRISRAFRSRVELSKDEALALRWT